MAAPRAAAAPAEPAQPEKSSSSTPGELQEYIDWLEQWALANEKEARQDTVAFWSLKAPAIVIASSAGLIAIMDSAVLSEVAGASAAALIAIDGVRPRGLLRQIHRRAFLDLRTLQGTLYAKWRARPNGEKPDNAVRRIIRDAEPERLRIAAYIGDGEAPKGP